MRPASTPPTIPPIAPLEIPEWLEVDVVDAVAVVTATPDVELGTLGVVTGVVFWSGSVITIHKGWWEYTVVADVDDGVGTIILRD